MRPRTGTPLHRHPATSPRFCGGRLRAALLGALCALPSLLAHASCGGERALPPGREGLRGEAGEGAGPLVPPGAGGGGSGQLCGDQTHEAIVDAPNLYFVFDASGSMLAPEGKGTRYDAVRVAAVGLVRSLGPLARVGAAVFPRGASECGAGAEVFPVTQGDPKTEDPAEEGPTTRGFRLATIASPSGGTPTAATLEALRPRLAALPGRTIVILATDGGPNCNENATCGADGCMPNIEGECPTVESCCDPGGLAGPTLCVDRERAVAAVAALAELGIDVYVVGVPGSATYASVLDDMAVAGNTARAGTPRHHGVADVEELAGVFGEIAQVALRCELSLSEVPEEPGKTNVYLDGEVVLHGAEDEGGGWVWKDPSTVELVGEACDALLSGDVKEVRIVSGCPTAVPR